MGKMKYIYQLVEELINEHKESYKTGGKYDSN